MSADAPESPKSPTSPTSPKDPEDSEASPKLKKIGKRARLLTKLFGKGAADNDEPAEAGRKVHKAGDTVWYEMDMPGQWSPCKVETIGADGAITLKANNVAVVVNRDEIASQILPCQENLPQNLAELPRDGLGPAGVEDILRQHICNSLPYTNVADVLLVVNPSREMPIYDSTWLDKYAELKSSLPPHIYNASAMAFKTLTEQKTSQAILLIGRPGSGKSKAMHHLLGFLGHNAGSGDGFDQLLGHDLEVALRPFISVSLECGGLQWKSTRCLFKLDLSFDEDDFICRAVADVKLLESRAGRPGDGATYEVFYKALRDRQESKQWLGDKEDFKLLGEEFDLEEYDKDELQLAAWKKAMTAFQIDSAPIIRFLCGLLLLGEVTFSQTEDGISCEGHEQAAKALGAKASWLAECLKFAGKPIQADAAVKDPVHVADAALRDTIEDLYRGLLTWILQKVNSAMAGDSTPSEGPTITLIDTPATPSGWPPALPAPAGFDAVQLQWFTEAMKSQLVGGALQGKVQENNLSLRISRLKGPQTAEAAMTAIGGPKGLVAKIRELSKGGNPVSKDDFVKFIKEFEQQDSCTSVDVENADHVSCKISGVGGIVEHVLDEALVRGSLGPSAPKKVKEALSQSDFPLAQEILGTRKHPNVRSDLDEAEDMVGMILDVLQGQQKVRPWLVCCMRPNDKGTDKLVSMSVLKAQVEELLLTDIIHLAGQTKESIMDMAIAMPLGDFQKQYASLLPGVRSDDLAACRTEAAKLIQSIDDGIHGTVGADSVYGTQQLTRALEDLKASSKPPKTQQESQQASGLSAETQQDSRRGSRQHPPQGTQQEHRQQTRQNRADDQQDNQKDLHSGPQKRSPSKRAAALSNDSGERGPLRSMAGPQNAGLHLALSQMAALLRVAKESDTNLRKGATSLDVEVQELRQECDSWRVESDRLWMKVKELQEKVQGAKMRAPSPPPPV
jgi:energy-coupling factor transporter ATP-binding protein EcfA2